MEPETKFSHLEKSDISKRDNVDKLFGRKTQTEIIEEEAEKAAQRILKDLKSQKNKERQNS